jgi:hypothetical protein
MIEIPSQRRPQRKGEEPIDRQQRKARRTITNSQQLADYQQWMSDDIDGDDTP